ncbi:MULTISPECIES: hypothetical protein [unclassified Streptomyces]|uniref:hypothetical protein n=1 Tax=unclassified Streptomyces TaxID=2593676 RepID=UPI0004C16394|nr:MULTISPECIES: hypothetical protein [unclassified Streptomyces]
MYGHGMQPPARTRGSVIAIRVLVFFGSFFSIGLLAFLPLFRIAVLSRRSRDWLFAVVSVPLIITCFAVVGSLPESNPLTDVGIIVLLLLGAGSGTYYILFDMRRRHSPLYGPVPQTGAVYPPGPRQGYGYPAPPQQPYAPRPVPPQPYAATQAAPGPVPAPAPQPPYPSGPSSTPVPSSAESAAGRPGPARIDQVRAELDELSDYLRKQEGDR